MKENDALERVAARLARFLKFVLFDGTFNFCQLTSLNPERRASGSHTSTRAHKSTSRSIWTHNFRATNLTNAAVNFQV